MVSQSTLRNRETNCAHPYTGYKILLVNRDRSITVTEEYDKPFIRDKKYDEPNRTTDFVTKKMQESELGFLTNKTRNSAKFGRISTLHQYRSYAAE